MPFNTIKDQAYAGLYWSILFVLIKEQCKTSFSRKHAPYLGERIFPAYVKRELFID